MLWSLKHIFYIFSVCILDKSTINWYCTLSILSKRPKRVFYISHHLYKLELTPEEQSSRKQDPNQGTTKEKTIPSPKLASQAKQRANTTLLCTDDGLVVKCL